MSIDSYVIENPNLKTTLHRIAEFTITMIAWLIWIYLIMPLLTALLWLVGIRLVIIEHISRRGIVGLLSVIGNYLFAIIGIWLVLQAWNFYSSLRFRGKERRKSAKPVTDDELARFFDVEVDALRAAKHSRRVDMAIEGGKLTLIDGPSKSLGTYRWRKRGDAELNRLVNVVTRTEQGRDSQRVEQF